MDTLKHWRRTAHRSGRAEAETLADIGRRISASLNLPDVLQRAAESARTLVGADVVAISLTQGDPRLRAEALVGNRSLALAEVAPPLDTGLVRQVTEQSAPVQVHWDAGRGTAASPLTAIQALETEGILSTLAVPILGGGETIGVLWIHARSRRDFKADEVALLERLSAQAGVAITNARAHAQEREARADVEALLAATAILGVQAEPDAVLRTLIEQAAALLDAELAHYAILRAGRLMIPSHWWQGRWVEGEQEVLSQGTERLVWLSGHAYRTNDAHSDPHSNPTTLERYDIRSQITAPLAGSDGEVLGIVTISNSRGPEGFTDRDERLLAAICETGASVLQRANGSAVLLETEREVTKGKQRVEALLAAADQLNSTNETDEVLRRIVAMGTELLGVRRAGIATNEGDVAVRRYTLVDGDWTTDETRLVLDQSIANWVIQHARPFRSGDFADSPRLSAHVSTGMPEAALAVPIFARDGSLLGSLQLFDPNDGHPFTSDDERLAEGVAHQAAIALERAQLVDELRRREEHLRRQAVTDSLTGLPNRTLFLGHLERAAAHQLEHAHGLAVLYLDLDGFKLVNDSLGHGAGDQLLKVVAQRIVSCVPPHQTVARLGGDEFGVLLDDISEPHDAVLAGQRIIADLEGAPGSDRQGMFISVSVGISFRAKETRVWSPEDLMREADIALYQAKALGKSQAAVFTPSMGEAAVERLELQTSLYGALDRGELQLLYQPIVELKGGYAVGAEALMRWQRPGRPVLQPDSFIPLAEETGAMFLIGRWTLEEACRQTRDWPRLAATGVQPFVSVNLSACQFEQRDLMRQVRSALSAEGLEPSALQLEIAETTIIQNPRTAIATLRALKKLGISIAIDGFGSGYSSLNCLQQLPVDWLKINRAFIRNLQAGAAAAAGSAAVEAIIAMAHALGIRVTAEGVESARQLSVLSTLGCDCAQGYYLSYPAPAEELSGMWNSAHPLGAASDE